MSESKLHILQHPVVNARLTKLRQTTTTGKEFREVRLSYTPSISTVGLMFCRF